MATIYGLANSDFSEASGDRLEARKQTHEKSVFYSQTGAIVAGTQYVFALKGSTATIKWFRARIEETVATGADRTVDVNLQKSTGAGAYATILTGNIQFTNVSVLRSWVPTTSTVSNTALAADDVLRVVITVAGAAGAQAAGLTVELTLTPCDPTT